MQPLVTHSNAQRKAAALNTSARPCGSTAVRLKDRMRETIRTAGYSRRTFEAYWHWSAKFIRWAGLRHPQGLGAAEVEQYLNWLANDQRVSLSTQRQAGASPMWVAAQHGHSVQVMLRDYAKWIPRADRGRNLAAVNQALQSPPDRDSAIQAQ